MKNIHRSRRFWRGAGALVLASSLALVGCDTDELLEVEDPDTVNPGTLEDPGLIDIVVAGAIGEFTTAFSGGESYITVTGVMSDELFASGSFTTRIATDRREQFTAQNGNTSDGTYVNLQQARRALRDAAADVEEVLGTGDDAYGRLKGLEGYTYVALAEGYCSGVPISNLNTETGEFEFGNPTTTNELLTDAVSIFDAAIGAGGAYANLAAVGKGRALVNQGQYAAAATAVAGVPTDFVYHVEHSNNAQNNSIFALQGNGRYSISDMEGDCELVASGGPVVCTGNGLDFRSANDPRVQWYEDPDGGFDANYPLYVSEKYTAFASPVALASGVEARLIEAEAALAGSQPGEMITILNDLRAQVDDLMAVIQPGYTNADGLTLDPLVDPGTEDARVDLLFRERGFWLFLTGTRLGDLRRLVRDYGRDQAEVYPSGTYVQGGDHGVDVVFEIDFDETNNPNYTTANCNVTSVN